MERDLFRAWLGELGACEEAREWSCDMTLAEAWSVCDRPEWMIWLAKEAGFWSASHMDDSVCADAVRSLVPLAELEAHLLVYGEALAEAAEAEAEAAAAEEIKASKIAYSINSTLF